MAPSSPPPLPGSPPESINPYEMLGVEQNATPDEIKRAYRKAALKHHPDKAATDQKTQAHKTFQTIAFAYSILSSPRRKARYDATGSTADVDLGDTDEDFNWADFYRAQFAEIISSDSIETFKRGYKGSEEERGDLLSSYTTNEGDLDRVFEEIMLSDPVEDEERFRGIIDEAIEKGEVQSYKAYVRESKKKRRRRVEKAKREEEEVRELARELGVEDKIFGEDDDVKKGRGKKKGGDDDGEGGLMVLIQQRMKSRAERFLDGLEEKYTKIENEMKAKRKAKKGQGGTRKRKADDVVEDEGEEEVDEDGEDGLKEKPRVTENEQKAKRKPRRGGRRKKTKASVDIDEDADAVMADGDGLVEAEEEIEMEKEEPVQKSSSRQKRQGTGGAGGRQHQGRASKRARTT